ncbi:MAG: deoxyribonuclease IV [Desulfovibrio sp.]
MPQFGAHMSISGGTHNAFDHIQTVNGQVLQVFTRNQRRWAHKPVNDEEIRLFKAGWKVWGEFPVFSHASYLINLASPKNEGFEKSIKGLADELIRCSLLGINKTVLHPGSHLGAGLNAGTSRIAQGLERVYELAAEAGSGAENVSILLENMAGQGNVVGGKFSELAMVREKCAYGERLGVCLDTCHAFAAGYDISTHEGVMDMVDEFQRDVGIEHLKFMHLNDSKSACGSATDRHEHIGKGGIGLEGFSVLVNLEELSRVPMVIETPKEGALDNDISNIKLLKSLVTS